MITHKGIEILFCSVLFHKGIVFAANRFEFSSTCKRHEKSDCHLAVVPECVVVHASKHNVEHPESNRKESTRVVMNNVEIP